MCASARHREGGTCCGPIRMARGKLGGKEHSGQKEYMYELSKARNNRTFVE